MKGSKEMQAECPARQRAPRKNASRVPGMGIAGFSLVEMIIAMTLLAIVISVFLLLGVQMTAMTNKARLRDQAVTFAQSGIESIRANTNTLTPPYPIIAIKQVDYGSGTINLTRTISPYPYSTSPSTPSLFKVVVTVKSSLVTTVTMETYILRE